MVTRGRSAYCDRLALQVALGVKTDDQGILSWGRAVRQFDLMQLDEYVSGNPRVTWHVKPVGLGYGLAVWAQNMGEENGFVKRLSHPPEGG